MTNRLARPEPPRQSGCECENFLPGPRRRPTHSQSTAGDVATYTPWGCNSRASGEGLGPSKTLSFTVITLVREHHAALRCLRCCRARSKQGTHAIPGHRAPLPRVRRAKCTCHNHMKIMVAMCAYSTRTGWVPSRGARQGWTSNRRARSLLPHCVQSNSASAGPRYGAPHDKAHSDCRVTHVDVARRTEA